MSAGIRCLHAVAVLVLLSACSDAQTEPPGSTSAQHGPVVVDSKTDVTLSGLIVSNQDGDCLRIRNAKSVIVEDGQIGPCKRHGINISGSADVVIRRSQILDTQGIGVNVYDSYGLQIVGNRIERNASGVYVHDSRNIQVQYNEFRDVFGPVPRGQFVQFNAVTGGRNRITCNTGTNSPGKSSPEDAINVFASNGVPEDPILVMGNRITGGGPSTHGGGILLGDGGGAWQVARANILKDPGQYGIAVAGGQNMVIADNVIYARSQPFTNVGIYVWNQYDGMCSEVAVLGNSVDWQNKHGQKNSRWDAKNCGPIKNWEDNTWDAVLLPDSMAALSSACDQ